MELSDRLAIDPLIIATAEARLDHIASAREHLEAADAEWPTDLDTSGCIATAPDGVHWFETGDELNRPRGENEQTLLLQSP